MPHFSEIFAEFQEHLNKEQAVRDAIKKIVTDIDTAARKIATILQSIHHDEAGIIDACYKARGIFEDVRVGYAQLSQAFPLEDYYRYRDHWRNVTKSLCFSAALIVWLEAGFLISRETTAEILGVKSKEEDGFHLDIEEFLMGLLDLSSELARFAVNSVTRGDYSRPLQISQFVLELNAGFRLLNLKNDHLRKRFDVLKYDVKKIEEVVYDLSLRGLIPGQEKPSIEGV